MNLNGDAFRIGFFDELSHLHQSGSELIYNVTNFSRPLARFPCVDT